MELGPFTFWELLTCVVVVSVLVSVVGVWYSHRRLSGRVSEGHNDVIVPIYATAGVIYAVLLAFIVIAVWEAFTASTENVADEASAWRRCTDSQWLYPTLREVRSARSCAHTRTP